MTSYVLPVNGPQPQNPKADKIVITRWLIVQISSVIKSMQSNCIFALKLIDWHWIDIYDYRPDKAHCLIFTPMV